MQPEQSNNSSSTPTGMTSSPAPSAAVHKRRTLALWLLIGPSALFVVSFIIGLISMTALPADSAARAAVNIFIFASGALVVLTWLPGIVIGCILLAKKQ